MLGFEVYVTREEAASGERSLARWMTGPFGLKWIDELVSAGKASAISKGGYPTIFSVSAEILMPILLAGLPESKSPPVIGDDYYLPENWSGSLHADPEELANCPTDAVLIIEAWDQS